MKKENYKRQDINIDLANFICLEKDRILERANIVFNYIKKVNTDITYLQTDNKTKESLKKKNIKILKDVIITLEKNNKVEASNYLKTLLKDLEKGKFKLRENNCFF